MLEVLPELVAITAATEDESFIAAVDAMQKWLTSRIWRTCSLSTCRNTIFRVVSPALSLLD